MPVDLGHPGKTCETKQHQKQSHLTSVYKGKSTYDPSNYSPIAVVPNIAKDCSHIVIELHSHAHQGTYQHGKSTEDILLVAIDTIALHLDQEILHVLLS